MKRVGAIRVATQEFEFGKATFSLSRSRLTIEAKGPEVELTLGPIDVGERSAEGLAGFEWTYEGDPGELLLGEEYIAMFSAVVEVTKATKTELSISFELKGVDDREAEMTMLGQAVLSKRRS